MVRVRVWDLPLRLFHWLLAVLVIGSLVTGLFGAELGLRAAEWHKLFGYAVLVLLLFRLLWGFVGGTYARFGSFVRGPRAVAAYLGELTGRRAPRPMVGHNPLGGWSTLAMLLCLSVQAGTGLFLADEDLGLEGPLSKYVSGVVADRLGTVHETNFMVLLFLIGLHLAAIAFYRLAKGQNLVKPMITGFKELPSTPDGDGASGGSVMLALILLLCSAGAVWLIANRF
ncbi:MAG TPA: cytochrome b/b6 domain-containing protein [Noviherbaspirillum sp.]